MPDDEIDISYDINKVVALITLNKSKISELEKKYNIIGEKIPETIHKYYTKNKKRIEKLENHDIFRIWNSMRTGGKTTLDAILKDNKRIQILFEKYKDIQEVLRETLKEFEENHDDSIHRDFFTKQLEKLDKEKDGEKEPTDKEDADES